MTDMIPTTARVEVKSAWASKINWTQAVGFVAMMLTTFGIDMPADLQVKIVTAIGGVQAVVTWLMRTFFTASVTPSSLPPTSMPSQ